MKHNPKNTKHPKNVDKLARTAAQNILNKAFGPNSLYQAEILKLKTLPGKNQKGAQ